MKNIIEKMFSPSTILGSLVFISHLDLFSLLQPHLHEQIVLHSDTPASRYSTVSFGSHSQINTTWTRRHKQLSSASSSSSSTYAVWGIVLLASSILKDFHISQKVTLSPWIKHTKIHKKEVFSCNSFFFWFNCCQQKFCLHVNLRQMLSRNCSSAEVHPYAVEFLGN